MRSFIGVCSLALMLSFVVASMAAFADEQADDGWTICDAFTLQVENDEPGGSDRHYSSGGRLACVRPAPDFLKRRLRSWQPEGAVSRQKASYGLGQNVYTPDDLTDPDPIDGDQPYAGWLYLDLGVSSEVSNASGEVRYVDQYGLQLGVVGSASGAGHAQRYLHGALDATEPLGWDNQLDNEPGINLFYSRQWTGFLRLSLPENDGVAPLAIDLTPKLGAALGNVYINGAGGLTLRLGHFARNDHGPPAIRPSFPGADDFPRHDGWSGYIFGGVEGRVVGRNIFLDGNSFDDDSPNVDKNTLVGETRLGAALAIGAVRLSYTQVFRSQEFEGQEPQTYGAATLSIGF